MQRYQQIAAIFSEVSPGLLGLPSPRLKKRPLPKQVTSLGHPEPLPFTVLIILPFLPHFWLWSPKLLFSVYFKVRILLKSGLFSYGSSCSCCWEWKERLVVSVAMAGVAVAAVMSSCTRKRPNCGSPRLSARCQMNSIEEERATK